MISKRRLIEKSDSNHPRAGGPAGGHRAGWVARRALGPGSATVFWIGAVVYSPGLMYADQSGELNRGYRLGVYCLVIALAVALVALVLRRLTGIGLGRLLAGVSVFWLIISQAGPIGSRLEIDPFAVVGLAVGAGLLVGRLWSMAFVRSGAFVVGTVAALTPLLTLTVNVTTREPVELEGDNYTLPLSSPGVEVLSDVWFVVLDGYPSDYARVSLHGLSPSPLVNEFSGEGGFFNPDAVSPYPITRFAVPAILQGRPPVAHQTELGPGAGPALRSVVSGDNRLMRTLDQLGYQMTVVENGWHLAGCADYIDRCQPAPIVDDQLEMVIRPTLLDEMLGLYHDSANPFGLKHLRGWMANNVERLTDNGTADAVFLHFIAPHPPFVFDSSCTEMSRGDLRQQAGGEEPYYWGKSMRDRRIQLYEGQLACVDSIIGDLMLRVDDSATVAVVGDHGSASMGQLLEADGRNWDREMLRERLLTLAAVRLQVGCEADLSSTMGISSAIVACLTGADFEPSEPVAFVVKQQQKRDTVYQLSQDAVEELADVEEAARAAK